MTECSQFCQLALSTSINIDIEPVGQNLVVKRYLKDVSNIRSSLPKYSYTWDVGVDIQHLSRIEFDDLKSLILKLVKLLALLCG